jgi:hypothetical protein
MERQEMGTARTDGGDMTNREKIARIINPDLYVEYDLLMEKGILAENGKLWADVVFGLRIARLLEKADAILALLARRVEP